MRAGLVDQHDSLRVTKVAESASHARDDVAKERHDALRARAELRKRVSVDEGLSVLAGQPLAHRLARHLLVVALRERDLELGGFDLAWPREPVESAEDLLKCRRGRTEVALVEREQPRLGTTHRNERLVQVP